MFLLIAALLLTTGALAWAGCGSGTSSATGTGVVAGLDPLVAAAKLVKEAGDPETSVGGVTQIRNLKDTYEIEASDARVSGTNEVTINADLLADGSGTMWGSWVITNSKGTWVCDKWTGAIDVGTVNRFTYAEAKGTGEYEGLTLYMQQHFASGHMEMLPPSEGYALSGWIQKSE
jgi:hypothetical protein